MKNFKILPLVAACAILVSGCAPRLGSTDYDINEVGRKTTVQKGYVKSVTKGTFNDKDPSKGNAGTAIGGIAGGILGAQIGGGRGQLLAAGAGAIAGAVAGTAIGDGMRSQEGFIYRVMVTEGPDAGREIVVSQGADIVIPPKAKVIIMETQGGRSRIIPDNGM